MVRGVLRQEKKNSDSRVFERFGFSFNPGGGVLPNILGVSVPHGSQNPDPISDQNV